MSASRDAGPDQAFELAESRQQAREALDSLPEPLRTAVHLIYYQGMKYREAAVALDIPVGTVKSRLHTAIRRLGELLGTSGRETDSAGNSPSRTANHPRGGDVSSTDGHG